MSALGRKQPFSQDKVLLGLRSAFRRKADIPPGQGFSRYECLLPAKSRPLQRKKKPAEASF
jgi:hypothetical protein